MEKQLTFRCYKKEDFKVIKNIIREAWKYDSFASPKIADKMAAVFLNSCLANQTFTQVAVLDNTPVGIIMGKNIKKFKNSFTLLLKRTISIFDLLCRKEGRNVSKIFGNVNGIDKELLESSPIQYDGEVAFFAVDKQCRGYGIGKQLFSKLNDYMESECVKNYYLFTDTSCNYGFYEHQGMVRRCEKQHTFEIKNQIGNITFFIYDNVK